MDKPNSSISCGKFPTEGGSDASVHLAWERVRNLGRRTPGTPCCHHVPEDVSRLKIEDE